MFRNYLSAALRNLVRNPLYTAINIAGLTVGFAAALLIAVFVRDELTYDRYFPGHENIYLLDMQINLTPTAPTISDRTDPAFAALLRLDFPFIDSIARMAHTQSSIRVGDTESTEQILWGDPNIFEILKFRSVAGDVDSALLKPDGIVLTRSLARKYFGSDAPLGKTLEVKTSDSEGSFTSTVVSSGVFTVTAIIEDLPYNVHLQGGAIAAGWAAMSPLTVADADPGCPGCIEMEAMTYLKLPDQAAAQRIAADLPAFVRRHKQYEPRANVALHLNSLASLHFAPAHGTPGNGTKPRGDIDAIFAMGAIGLLILSTASINYVNLMTARASRRATEVGVRKVGGAAQRHLIAQFTGESLIYVLVSLGLGLGIAALLLPAMNGFLDRTLRLDLSNPASGAFAVALAGVVGVLAGFYPAVVLSSYRPAVVLKAGASQGPASSRLRQFLVTLQFALLICLLIATAVIKHQVDYALTDALRLNADEVVIVNGTCRPALKEAVAALPGVRAATCSTGEGLTGHQTLRVTPPGGDPLQIPRGVVDPGFFEFYGLTPIAGRILDGRASDQTPGGAVPPTVVINEAAVSKFGFASPQEAIGQTLVLRRETSPPSQIVGVVGDFAADTIRNPVEPTIFYISPGEHVGIGAGGQKYERGLLSVRLVGAQVPETLEEIDRLWKQLGPPQPISRYFLKQWIQTHMADVSRQQTLFAIAAGVAIFIALLGLFGMSVFVAEHRTKEIGIRKAMGATRRDILGILLRQFTKPVLWANIIAWPASYLIMRRWLEGFAYHIELSPWIFLTASALALVIAVATVIGHALTVARAQPVSALRYE